MNAARAPTDETLKGEVVKEYQKGIKPKALSEKFGISVNTIKSWIKRDKLKTGEPIGGAPGKKEGAPPIKKKGAPAKNKNAEGAGAPEGNQNALKHGGYSSVYWDVLDEDEREMIEGTPTDEEALLIEQIRLFAVRERRLMKAINQYTGVKGGVYVAGVTRHENKRSFKNAEEEERYNQLNRKKVEKGEKLPGQGYDLTTSTNATIDLVGRLERELTSVQSKKTKAIDSLSRLHLENRRIDNAGKGNDAADDWIACMMGEMPEGGDTP